MIKYVGAHVSVEGGVENAPLNAHKINAKAFAFFSRNPSRWKSTPLKEKSVELFKKNCAEFGYKPENILPEYNGKSKKSGNYMHYPVIFVICIYGIVSQNGRRSAVD